MLVGPLLIRPVFTHNQFYVVASFLHNILGYRFISVLVSFPVLRYVPCHVTISRFLTFWREFYLRVAVLVRKIVL